jgi:hypothetical protein
MGLAVAIVAMVGPAWHCGKRHAGDAPGLAKREDVRLDDLPSSENVEDRRRPGSDMPIQKVAFVTKVGDQVAASVTTRPKGG